MKYFVFGLAILSCAIVVANSESGIRNRGNGDDRVPTEWVNVHTNAIEKWKTVNKASDGVFVDKAARRVCFLAEATGVRGDDAVEFFAIAPLSDRAYESLLVSVASPLAIARACDAIGLPRGRGADAFAARLWPFGEKVSVRVRALSSATNVPVSFLVKDVRAKNEGEILSAPVVWTGGARDVRDVPVANTNMPGAVFALYNHAPSLLQLDGMMDQSSTYGRFVAADSFVRGDLFEILIEWDGKTHVKDVVLTVNATNVASKISNLRETAKNLDLYVRLAFDSNVTVGEAETMARAFAMLDGSSLKMNGAADGQFYFRSFLPDPAWRERSGRVFQPFEIHIAADGAKLFVFCEEDWSGEGTEPVLKPRTTPFKEWRELPALIAKTGEQGAKVKVVFIFAPKTMPVAALVPVIPSLGSRVNTFYVFGS